LTLRCDRNNEQKGKRDNDEEEDFAAVNSYDPFDIGDLTSLNNTVLFRLD